VSTPITITITAQTAEAAAKMQQFFTGATRGLNQLTGASAFLQTLGGRLAAAFSVTSMVAFTRQTINLADELGKLSQRVGLSVEMLDALRRQGEVNDVTFQDMANGLRFFNDRLFAAARQGGQMAQVFRDLRISVTDARGVLRPTQDILDDVADAFAGMADGPQKTAAAIDLFSRSGEKWIPLLNQGAEAMERMRGAGGLITREDTQRAEEFNDTLTRIKQNLQDMFIALNRDLLPALQRFADQIESFSGLSLQGMFLSIAMEFSKNMLTGLLHAAEFFGEALITFVDQASTALADAIIAGLNAVANWINRQPFLTRLIGGSFQGFERDKAGHDARIAEWLKLLHEGGAGLREDVAGWFDKRIALARTLRRTPKLANATDASENTSAGKPPPPDSDEVVVSEAALKLISDIDRAHAEATQSRLALLAIEQSELKAQVDREILDKTKAEEQKLKIDEVFAARRKEILDKQAEEDAARRQKELDEKIRLTQRDWRLTDVEKFNALAGSGLSDQELGPDPNSLADQFLAGWVRVRNEIGTVAQSAADTLTNLVGGAIQNISNGLTGLIMGTQTWAGFLRQIGTTVLNTVIQGITRLFMAWITGERAKSAASIASNTAEAAAKAPGALMESIKSYGVAAIVGAAAFAAAMAIGGAFAEGGRPDPGKVSLVGERGPELFVPDTAGTIIPAHQTARIMEGAGGRVGGIRNETKVNFAVFDLQRFAEQWARNQEGETWFIDMLNKHAHRLQS
jgi:hypothetical protein